MQTFVDRESQIVTMRTTLVLVLLAIVGLAIIMETGQLQIIYNIFLKKPVSIPKAIISQYLNYLF